MTMFKRKFRLILCLCLFLTLSIGFCTVSHATAVPFQVAYDFDTADLCADVGGAYPLSDDLFGTVSASEGKTGNGINSYISFDETLFSGNTELSFSAWFRFTSMGGIASKKILHAGSAMDTAPRITLTYSNATKSILIDVTDGIRIASTSVSVSGMSVGSTQWVYVAFVIQNSDGVQTLTLYVNDSVQTVPLNGADISLIDMSSCYLTNFGVDELYLTNTALDFTEISTLKNSSVRDFYLSRTVLFNQSSVPPTVPSDPTVEDPFPTAPDPVVPNDPYTPVTPSVPSYPSYPSASVSPVSFSWAAYCFDQSFAAGRDLNGVLDCDVDEMNMTLVNTETYGGPFGYGLTRRTGRTPSCYLTLPSGMLLQKTGFSVSLWVYHRVDTATAIDLSCNEYVFDFSGLGRITFSPYHCDFTGKSTAMLTYYDGYNFQIKELQDVGQRNRWVHYAFTFDAKGTIRIYVNAKLTETVATGMNLSNLNLTSLSVLGGTMVTQSGTTVIDDVYVSSKVLTDSDVRKLRAYGAAQFVSSVLPDPSGESQTESSLDSETNLLIPDASDTLEDAYNERATMNGYIGSTFDDYGFIGKDVNNMASAEIRSASLTQGVNKYGLAFDGTSSYIRYPQGILDNVSAITVGISYLWNGHAGSAKTQRLFDFSYKASALDAPDRYLYLDMGDGQSGMTLCISDGTYTTTLACAQNTIATWCRVTVTVGNGHARIYLDGKEVASTATNVDVSKICPNFCYIGKSGVKGDPLFRGSVDEVYIGASVLTETQIVYYQDGLSGPQEDNEMLSVDNPFELEETIWDEIMRFVLIATGVLMVIILVVVVITVIKK